MFATITLSPAIDTSLTVEGPLSFAGVHSVRAEMRTPGGKGINVAKILAANGADVRVGGLLGKAEAVFFGKFLRTAGVKAEFLLVPFQTRENLMIADAAGREIKINRQAFPELAPDWPALEQYCLRLCADANVAIISGSLPARFPDQTYARLARLLRSRGKALVLDTGARPLALALQAGLVVVKPNRAEFEELVGHPVRTVSAMKRELARLLRGCEVVIVSDGPNGAWFADGAGVFRAATPRVRALDSTGAGDALLGQFCHEYFGSAGRRLTPEAMALAVAAGAAAVETRGTPVPDMMRVRELARAVRVDAL